MLIVRYRQLGVSVERMARLMEARRRKRWSSSAVYMGVTCPM
jgi:hypothetical protein